MEELAEILGETLLEADKEEPIQVDILVNYTKEG